MGGSILAASAWYLQYSENGDLLAAAASVAESAGFPASAMQAPYIVRTSAAAKPPAVAALAHISSGAPGFWEVAVS